MKKFAPTIALIATLLLTPAFSSAQTEATVSKVLTSYKGLKNENTKAIKKDTASNALGVLLQVSLINAGFNPGEPDGVVGGKTTQAVKQLQTAFGLQSDGVFGPATAKALRDFSDQFPGQKVTEVKNVAPKEFASFKASLKPQKVAKKTPLDNSSFGTVPQIPSTPKGVLTYVLSKNQPDKGMLTIGSNSLVGQIVANASRKPKLATTSNTKNTTSLVNPGGVASNNDSAELDTNFNSSSLSANSRYECTQTSEHTEYCRAVSLSGETNSEETETTYYCRGENCEVLGLANRSSSENEVYIAPTEFSKGIDFSQKSQWGEPVAFDKKTGKPIIFLRDHGYDPKNGKKNLSVVFVDLAEPVYNH